MRKLVYLLFFIVTTLFACDKQEESLKNDFNIEEIVLTNQFQVDSFGQSINEYEFVSIRDLHIQGNNIISLSEINNKIKNIGSLYIDNTCLFTLNGLGDIETITELNILNNKNLQSLDINILDTAILELEIGNNDSISSLIGLENLTRIFYLKIRNNEQLNSMQELSNLNMTDETIIDNNDALVSLDGLSSIHLKGSSNFGFIYIANNDSLIDFCSIENIIYNENFNVTIQNNKYNPTAEDFNNDNCILE